MAKAKTPEVYSDPIVTPIGRVMFPFLEEPDTEGDYATGKYKITLLVPSDADITSLKTMIRKIVEARWGAARLNNPDFMSALAHPLKNKGDDKYKRAVVMHGEDSDEAKRAEIYRGHMVWTMRTKTKPRVVGVDRADIPADKVYGGCYARCAVQIGTYEGKDGPGITFALVMVQKVRDGDRLGGSATSVSSDIFGDDLPPEDITSAASDLL